MGVHGCVCRWILWHNKQYKFLDCEAKHSLKKKICDSHIMVAVPQRHSGQTAVYLDSTVCIYGATYTKGTTVYFGCPFGLPEFDQILSLPFVFCIHHNVVADNSWFRHQKMNVLAQFQTSKTWEQYFRIKHGEWICYSVWKLWSSSWEWRLLELISHIIRRVQFFRTLDIASLSSDFFYLSVSSAPITRTEPWPKEFPIPKFSLDYELYL